MCDVVGISRAGGMWFAKNSDRHPAETQTVAWHSARRAQGELRTQYLALPDSDASAFVGSQPDWLWGCEHGVNEHGVAIGNEKIWTIDRPKSRPPALLGMDVVRLALERARNADDALSICTDAIERYGQGGSGEPHADIPYDSSFLIVDGNSGWILETCNRTWAARPVGKGGAISNRVTLSTDWTRASTDIAAGTDFDTYRRPSMPTTNADQRLATTRAAIANAEPTLTSIVGLMRDHGSDAWPAPLDDSGRGITVCMHCPSLDSQTTASMVVDIAADSTWRAWACLGNPCVGVYMPVFSGAVAPELSESTQWQRFARLRDRVEADPERLADVRVILDPVEQELWAMGDAAATGDRGSFAATAYRGIDAALRRLDV